MLKVDKDDNGEPSGKWPDNIKLKLPFYKKPEDDEGKFAFPLFDQNTKEEINQEDIGNILDNKIANLKGKNAHSPLMGYMIDGYPIYGPLGTNQLTFDKNTSVKILNSSYALKYDLECYFWLLQRSNN